MYKTTKAQDAEAFGRDLMRLAESREAQNEILGALFRAMVFGVEAPNDDGKQPA